MFIDPIRGQAQTCHFYSFTTYSTQSSLSHSVLCTSAAEKTPSWRYMSYIHIMYKTRSRQNKKVFGQSMVTYSVQINEDIPHTINPVETIDEALARIETRTFLSSCWPAQVSRKRSSFMQLPAVCWNVWNQGRSGWTLLGSACGHNQTFWEIAQ